MSHQFKTVTVVRKKQEDGTHVLQTPAIEGMDRHMALLLPVAQSGTPHEKAMIECAVNLLVQVCDDVKPSTTRVDREDELAGKTDPDIHREMLGQLKQVSQALAAMIHSASWRDGDYKFFDRVDLNSKLSYGILKAGDENE